MYVHVHFVHGNLKYTQLSCLGKTVISMFIACVSHIHMYMYIVKQMYSIIHGYVNTQSRSSHGCTMCYAYI